MATDLQVGRAGTSAPVMRQPYVPTGPDRERFDYVERTIQECAGPRGAKPLYDSVVVVGGHGITSHTFAARLARSPEFAGRVVLAGPSPVEDRRLKAGVSLRGSACDFLAYALDRSTTRWCGRSPVPTSQLRRSHTARPRRWRGRTGPRARTPTARWGTGRAGRRD